MNKENIRVAMRQALRLEVMVVMTV